MTEPALFELLRVECSGTPRELGRAQGEALAKRISAFVDQRLDALRAYLAERGESARYPEFVGVGAACLDAARHYDPDGAAEHCGIAEAADIDAGVLYAVTNMTDVRDVLVLPAPAAGTADIEGCTSLLVPAGAARDSVIIAGQTWDLNPTDLEFVVAVHRRPSEGPETWAITCAGSLSLIGMNAEGVAVGTTNIKTRASRVGVGYLSILHRAIRSRTLAEAAEQVQNAERAAAHTYWVADATGALELECDPNGVVERALGAEPIVQTNHCQAEDLRAREGEAPSASSLRRLERAHALLSSGNGAHDVDTIRRVFSDRADGVDSINRYTEDQQGTTTNACIVCVPARRELWACRGSADRGRWEHLGFAGAEPE